jgi:hypothetical protein
MNDPERVRDAGQQFGTKDLEGADYRACERYGARF